MLISQLDANGNKIYCHILEHLINEFRYAASKYTKRVYGNIELNFSEETMTRIIRSRTISVLSINSLCFPFISYFNEICRMFVNFHTCSLLSNSTSSRVYSNTIMCNVILSQQIRQGKSGFVVDEFEQKCFSVDKY